MWTKNEELILSAQSQFNRYKNHKLKPEQPDQEDYQKKTKNRALFQQRGTHQVISTRSYQDFYQSS